MVLTPKERVIAQIAHQETEHIPYTIPFDGDVEERLDAHFGSDAWRSQVDNAIQPVPRPIVPPPFEPEPGQTHMEDQYGSVWRVDRRPFHLEGPVLKGPTLDGFAFPEMDDLFLSGWKERIEAAAASDGDHFLVTMFGFGLFERTWALRGFEETLMDVAAHPDFYEALIEAVAEHQLAIIRRLVELPIDGIMFSDDWGYQDGVLLGPDRWRKLLKPHLARMYDVVHGAGKVAMSHCCGSVVDILPDMIEIGLDVLESVQPEARGMNPYGLKEQFGDQITFWGCLGSQSTIPFGSPHEIKDAVRKLCREMGRNGGYILAPAKPLLPETPTENALAVVEAFLEQAGTELS